MCIVDAVRSHVDLMSCAELGVQETVLTLRVYDFLSYVRSYYEIYHRSFQMYLKMLLQLPPDWEVVRTHDGPTLITKMFL